VTELVRSRAWWALVATLSALTLGLTFAHVLELPQRLGYDARLWTQLTRPNALYRYFGVVGGPLEVAAVLGVAVLAVILRRQRPAGRFALAAAVLHAAALGVWLGVVLPANIDIGSWSTGGIPADWERWRVRWETGHAVSFGLLLVGFGALVLAVLSERDQTDTGRDDTGVPARQPPGRSRPASQSTTARWCP
jgi:hypothetical protein